MQNANSQIGSAIRKARIKADLTQPELAKATGMKLPTIKAYEGGKINISATMLDKIASILGTSINNLLPSAKISRSKKKRAK